MTRFLAFLGRHLPTPRRRQYEHLLERLVRRYHDALVRHGVTGYDWPHCWSEFRLAVVRAPVGPANAWSTWGSPADPQSRWLPHVERAFALFDALRCEELLAA